MAVARLGPGDLHQANVLRISLRAAHLHKAAAHLLEHEVLAEGLHGVQLAIVPGALDELNHQHRMPLPTARRAVPMAAVVLPLPGPVLIRSSPRRESVVTAYSLQLTAISLQFAEVA
jgi:hypothetical protein